MGKALGGSILLMVALVFIMKVFIVKWAYNTIMPRLIVNNGNSIQKFQTIIYYGIHCCCFAFPIPSSLSFFHDQFKHT